MNGQLTDYRDAVRQCLIDLDVSTMRKLWKHVAPNMPQPDTDEDAYASMHYARTLTESIPFRARAYSHTWLMERYLRSGLPDELRPKAEQIYPRVVEGVGVAVLTTGSADESKRVMGLAVRDAMNSVVMDYYSTDKSHINPLKLRRDMRRARAELWRKVASKVGWK